MMNSAVHIERMVRRIRGMADCHVREPDGLPFVPEALSLPDDMVSLYRVCGGMVLFDGSDWPMEILGPRDVVSANGLIIGEAVQDDLSDSWYVFAKSHGDQYVTIDLSKQRLGRCHDSFWDRHAVAGCCPIIANGLISFLEQCLSARGNHLYWLTDDFEVLGDAYD